MMDRPLFECWKCAREFGQTVSLAGQPVLIVECPYCGAEGKVDLAPYRVPVVEIMKGEESETGASAYQLPDIIPTTEPDRE